MTDDEKHELELQRVMAAFDAPFDKPTQGNVARDPHHPEDWLVECKRGNFIFTDGPIQESDIDNLVTLFDWPAFVCPNCEGYYLRDVWDEGDDQRWRAEVLGNPDKWRVDVYGVQEFADEYPI